MSNAALKEFVGYNAIRSIITVTVVGLVGNTIWFYWNQTMWKDFDNEYCLESGYSLFYFILWILNLFITFWSALICTIGCCCFICCLPCICKLIKDVQGEQQRVQNDRNNILGAIVHIPFNAEDFKDNKEC